MTDRLSSDLASLRIERAPHKLPQPKRGPWVGVALGLGALAVVYMALAPRLRSAFFQTEIEVTEIASISPATASTELAASGYVIPQLLSRVGTKVPGKIARVEVSEGQRVERGALLVSLDASDQLSAVAAGEARVAAAEAEAQRQRVQRLDAERRLKREQALAAAGVTGQAAVEDLEAQVRALGEVVRAAEANIAAAKADLRTQVLGLEHLSIRAPIDGTVLTKPPEVGEVVSPSGAPLLELADFASLLVEVEVPETRLAKVRVGAPCEIMLDAYPSRRYRGVVKELSPVVNRAKATVVVKVGFVGEAEGVLPNMAARAFFLEDEKSAEQIGQPPKTVVPRSAVVERDGAQMVFVVDGNKVRMTPVTLGPTFGSGYELADGPRVGTKVVKNPPAGLADGQKIKERNAP